MADDTFAIVRCTSAKELLEALSPQNETWGNVDRRRWVFRGQGHDWPLVPTVLREDPKTKLTPWEWHLNEGIGASRDGAQGWQRRLGGEIGIVTKFRDLADQAGLAIPEDSARWRRLEEIAEVSNYDEWTPDDDSIGPMTWPSVHLISLVALAQHAGVPTRLLDWSWRPFVAAYFAAQNVMIHELDRHSPLAGEMVVWALNAFDLPLAVKKAGYRPKVDVVYAPQASNRNLAAQAGLFTVARGAHEGTTLVDVLKEEAEKSPSVRLSKLVRKYTIPVAEARSLMQKLAVEGISAATVLPGYRGVFESMREEDWYRGRLELAVPVAPPPP